jgi:hypothetical protein
MDSAQRCAGDLATAVSRTLSVVVNYDSDIIDSHLLPDKTAGW